MQRENDKNAISEMMSKLDTKMRIAQVSPTRIAANENNFFDVSNVDDLADSINLLGLQQPLVIAPGDDPEGFTLLAGHRRLKAILQLRKDNPERWATVPCVITTPEYAEYADLILIQSNTTARTSLYGPELNIAAERTAEALRKLQEEHDVKLPGRMRDRVADLLNVSASKLARAKKIDEHLIPELKGWTDPDCKHRLSEDAALVLSDFAPDVQEKWAEWIKFKHYDYHMYGYQAKNDCEKIANGTDILGDAKYAEEHETEIRAQRDAELKRSREDAAKAWRANPLSKFAARVREQREAKGMTPEMLASKLVEDEEDADEISCMVDIVDGWESCCDPYNLPEGEDLFNLSRALGCSVDYLLGICDSSTPDASAAKWQRNTSSDGFYLAANLTNAGWQYTAGYFAGGKWYKDAAHLYPLTGLFYTSVLSLPEVSA